MLPDEPLVSAPAPSVVPEPVAPEPVVPVPVLEEPRVDEPAPAGELPASLELELPGVPAALALAPALLPAPVDCATAKPPKASAATAARVEIVYFVDFILRFLPESDLGSLLGVVAGARGTGTRTITLGRRTVSGSGESAASPVGCRLTGA
jgi:hypothetical protein